MNFPACDVCPKCGSVPTVHPDHHPTPIPFVTRPEVVTLCGSTRFPEAFQAANRELTLQGCIVISVGVFGHIEGLDIGTDDEPSDIKRMLDELHLRKIDMADRIHVLNVGGYIGHSTANEIVYAKATGKIITYSDPLPVANKEAEND